MTAPLTGKGGQAAPGRPAEEAMPAAGLDPRGVSSGIDVPMDPDMPSGQAMLLVCRRLAEVVEANVPGAVDDLDAEFLHDLRVAVRRTRSVLKEMPAVLAPDLTQRSRRDLRWIQEITGPTRDLDVLLHDWPELTGAVPARVAADMKPLGQLLARRRAEAFFAMRGHLRSRRFGLAWDAWTSAVRDGPAGGPVADQPVGDLVGGRIRSVYRAMVEMGAAIHDASPPSALHDLRKRGKELRYLLELFGGLWPADRVKPLVVDLKELQDVLGRFQDDEIQVAQLRGLAPELAASPGGTGSLVALGFVLDGLRTDQRRARETFGARFADFSRPATRSIVEHTFGIGQRR